MQSGSPWCLGTEIAGPEADDRLIRLACRRYIFMEDDSAVKTKASDFEDSSNLHTRVSASRMFSVTSMCANRY